ncbi:hypothetical protein MBOT_38170 [Mycobacterium botniense]|uniref:Uncharacterized protein n=1 Tax=Mycobacterium botniense TaxID=84962 RepID=A0A7I9Y311_9MYCO|nr:hypothetical protein MBOT_38170 [Mycobacterium botniense]
MGAHLRQQMCAHAVDQQETHPSDSTDALGQPERIHRDGVSEQRRRRRQHITD